MIEKTKRFLCNPIVVIVCLVLAIGSVVAFAIVKNYNQSKADLVSKLDIATITKDKETGKLVAVLVDDKKSQEETYQEVNAKFQAAVNPEQALTNCIDAYVTARYNFTTGALSVKENVNKVIQDTSTTTFQEYVSTSLSQDKAQASTAKILKRFINARNYDSSQAQEESLKYIYIVDINGKNMVLKYEMKFDGKTWRLNDETLISSIEESDLF